MSHWKAALCLLSWPYAVSVHHHPVAQTAVGGQKPYPRFVHTWNVCPDGVVFFWDFVIVNPFQTVCEANTCFWLLEGTTRSQVLTSDLVTSNSQNSQLVDPTLWSRCFAVWWVEDLIAAFCIWCGPDGIISLRPSALTGSVHSQVWSGWDKEQHD